MIGARLTLYPPPRSRCDLHTSRARHDQPAFAQPADAERLEQTAEALRQRGFQVTIAESGDQARQLVLDALPEGAEVHTGLSETLQQIGLTEVLENSGRYDPVRTRLKQLDRETQGREMRKLGAAPTT